jgi:hypothetical protein
VEEVAVDAVSVDLSAPCFEEPSSGMVICLSIVVVETVVVLWERAIESEPVGRTVSGFFVLEEVLVWGRADESVDLVRRPWWCHRQSLSHWYPLMWLLCSFPVRRP